MATVIESKSRKGTSVAKQTKLCLHCGRVKPLADYYSNRDWDEQLGKDVWCKDCVNRCTTKDEIREYFWENHREWDERIWDAAHKKASIGTPTTAKLALLYSEQQEPVRLIQD